MINKFKLVNLTMSMTLLEGKSFSETVDFTFLLARATRETEVTFHLNSIDNSYQIDFNTTNQTLHLEQLSRTPQPKPVAPKLKPVNPSNPLGWVGRQRSDGWYGHTVAHKSDPNLPSHFGKAAPVNSFMLVAQTPDGTPHFIQVVSYEDAQAKVRAALGKLPAAARRTTEVNFNDVLIQHFDVVLKSAAPADAIAAYMYCNSLGTWKIMRKKYLDVSIK